MPGCSPRAAVSARPGRPSSASPASWMSRRGPGVRLRAGRYRCPRRSGPAGHGGPELLRRPRPGRARADEQARGAGRVLLAPGGAATAARGDHPHHRPGTASWRCMPGPVQRSQGAAVCRWLADARQGAHGPSRDSSVRASQKGLGAGGRRPSSGTTAGGRHVLRCLARAGPRQIPPPGENWVVGSHSKALGTVSDDLGALRSAPTME